MAFVDLLQLVNETSSTMTVARELALNGAVEGTTIAANRQTDGRGRRGRSWFSPGGGLYMTTLLRPSEPLQRLPQLAIVAGLAVRAACEEEGAPGARVKWPNDVVVGRKKLAGVLLETLTDRSGPEGPHANSVLVGIGVNLLERGEVDLPEELALRYIGLGDLVAHHPQSHVIAPRILRFFETRYRRWQQGEWPELRREFEHTHALNGQRVRAVRGDDTIEGTAAQLDDSGALQIATETGLEKVHSGEVVSLRPLKG